MKKNFNPIRLFKKNSVQSQGTSPEEVAASTTTKNKPNGSIIDWAPPSTTMETDSVWKTLQDPRPLNFCEADETMEGIPQSLFPGTATAVVIVLCLLLVGAVWQWRRRRFSRKRTTCLQATSSSSKTLHEHLQQQKQQQQHPKLVSARSTDGTFDTESHGSSSLASNDGEHLQSRSMFLGKFQGEDLDEFEAFENEPLQEIIADGAHNDYERTRLLQIEEQTRHLLLALGSMFQTSVEENRNSVQWLVHQELQSRDERMSFQERQQQELVERLRNQVQQLQKDLQQGLSRMTVPQGSVQQLMEQVNRLDKELQQERSILDKAVLATHEGQVLEKDIGALVARVQALEKAQSSPLPTTLEKRVQQLEKELKEEQEKNSTTETNRDLLFQKALADLTDQVEELEEKLEETIDANDATTSILETRLHLQAKAQELAVQNVDAKVDGVSADLSRVDQETKESIAQVKKDQEEQGQVFNSKLQALQDELQTCQEEWKAVLQGLQSWDEKLASYRKSQEKVTLQLAQQLHGLQGQVLQARKETEEKAEEVNQQTGLVKKRLQFWKNTSKSSSRSKSTPESVAPVSTNEEPIVNEIPAIRSRVVYTSEGCEMVGVETMAEF